MEELSLDELATVQGGYSDQLFANMQKAVSMGLTINSTHTGVEHRGYNYHSLGRAFDAIGTPGAMRGYYGWAAGNGHTTELIHKNQFLKNGKPIHPIGGHDTHVHTAV